MTADNEVALLKDLLGMYSPSCHESEVAAFIVEFAKKTGLQAHIDDAGNAVVEGGSGEREILLLGHMDTVEGEIPVVEKDGSLYGRGSVDANGPLAAFLCALVRVKDRLHNKRVVVVGAVEEEHHTSRGARHVCQTRSPEMIIIGEPSGTNTLTLGYKGSLQVRYEQSSSVVHGAAREEGAFDQAFGFYAKVRALVDSLNAGKKEREYVQLRVRGVEPSGTPFEEKIRLRLGFRLPIGFDLAPFKKKLQGLIGGSKLEFISEEVPFMAEKRTRLVSSFMKTLRAQDLQPRFSVKSGTSDMNVVGPHFNVPILTYGPGDSTLDHTPEEHIEIGEYLKAIDVLEQVLLEL